MNEQPLMHQSTIKKGLMMLNKLKGIQNVQERPKAQNMINTEKELQKYQVQVVSSDELMLSNADFHVKNLLTGFLEDIDEKSLGIETKIKKLRQKTIARPMKPMSEEEMNLAWGKSKSKAKTKTKKEKEKEKEKKNNNPPPEKLITIDEEEVCQKLNPQHLPHQTACQPSQNPLPLTTPPSVSSRKT